MKMKCELCIVSILFCGLAAYVVQAVNDKKQLKGKDIELPTVSFDDLDADNDTDTNQLTIVKITKNPKLSKTTSTTKKASTSSVSTVGVTKTAVQIPDRRSTIAINLHHAVLVSRELEAAGVNCSQLKQKHAVVSFQLRFLDRNTQPMEMTHYIDHYPVFISNYTCQLLFKPNRDWDYDDRLVNVTEGSRVQLTLSIRMSNLTGGITFVGSVYAWPLNKWGERITRSINGNRLSTLVWSYYARSEFDHPNCTTQSSSYQLYGTESTVTMPTVEQKCPAWVETSFWFVALGFICLLETSVILGGLCVWACVDWSSVYKLKRRQNRRRKRAQKQALVETTYNQVAIEQAMEDMNNEEDSESNVPD